MKLNPLKIRRRSLLRIILVAFIIIFTSNFITSLSPFIIQNSDSLHNRISNDQSFSDHNNLNNSSPISSVIYNRNYAPTKTNLETFGTYSISSSELRYFAQVKKYRDQVSFEHLFYNSENNINYIILGDNQITSAYDPDALQNDATYESLFEDYSEALLNKDGSSISFESFGPESDYMPSGSWTTDNHLHISSISAPDDQYDQISIVNWREGSKYDLGSFKNAFIPEESAPFTTYQDYDNNKIVPDSWLDSRFAIDGTGSDSEYFHYLKDGYSEPQLLPYPYISYLSTDIPYYAGKGFTNYAQYGFNSKSDLNSQSSLYHISKLLSYETLQNKIDYKELLISPNLFLSEQTSKGSALFPNGNGIIIEADKDQTADLTIEMNVDPINIPEITGAYVDIRACFQTQYSLTNKQFPIVDAQIKITFNMEDSTSFSKTIYGSDIPSAQYKKYHLVLTSSQLQNLNKLSSISVSFKGKVDDFWAPSRRAFVIAVDSISLSFTGKAGYSSQGMLYLDTKIPYSGSYDKGTDLSNNGMRSSFIDSIREFDLELKVNYPTLDSLDSIEINLIKPEIRDPTTNIIYRFTDTSGTFVRRGFGWNMEKDFSLHMDSSQESWSSSINNLIDYLFYDPNLSNNYLIGFYFKLSQNVGSPSTKIDVDFLKLSFVFESQFMDQSNISVDAEFLYWQAEIHKSSLYSLEPNKITIHTPDPDKEWSLVTERYYKEYGSDALISGSFNIAGDDPYEITGFSSRTEYLYIFFRSDNHLSHVSFDWINEFKLNDQTTKTIYLDHESIGRKYFPNSKISISVFLDKPYISSNGVVSGKIIDSNSNVIKSFELKRNMTQLHEYEQDPSGCTSLERYDYILDLSETKVSYGHIYSISFVYYSDRDAPTKIGVGLYDNYLQIVNNWIIGAENSFSVSNISYSFKTMAQNPYTAVVLMIESKSYNYESEINQTSVSITSDQIELTDLYVKNRFISRFTRFSLTQTPNPSINLTFSNNDLTNDHTLIIDEVSVRPAFAPLTIEKYLMKNTSISETIPSGSIKNISIPFNFNEMNFIPSRGIYWIYVRFHQSGETEIQDYLFREQLLFYDQDSIDYGRIINCSIFEDLTGAQTIEGNFSKNENASTIVAYIMDSEGYGSYSDNTYGKYPYTHFGNQYSPKISIISPIEEGNTYKTSYIQIVSNIYDQNDDLREASIRLFNSEMDTGILEYNESSYGNFVAVFNPFELTTGRINVEIVGIDDKENYAFATTYFFVESYKRIDLSNYNISLGKVNVLTTPNDVEASIPINYSLIDPSLLKTNTIYFDIGEGYDDAHDFKIQRSPIDIYYPERDLSNGISDIGRYSYWKFSNIPDYDILRFKLNAPIISVSLDTARSSVFHKEYYVMLRRHVNLRTYLDVSFFMHLSVKYSENLQVRVFDMTGGQNTSITEICNPIWGVDGQFNQFFFNFSVDGIVAHTDYQWKIIFDNEITEEEIEAQGRPVWIWLVGGGGGFVLGFIFRYSLSLFPQIIEKYPKMRKMKGKDIAIWGTIGAIIGIIIASIT